MWEVHTSDLESRLGHVNLEAIGVEGNLLATWVEEKKVATSALRRRRVREDKEKRDTSYHQSGSVGGGASISTHSSNEASLRYLSAALRQVGTIRYLYPFVTNMGFRVCSARLETASI